MTRRWLLGFLGMLVPALAEERPLSLRGKLQVHPKKEPSVLLRPDGKPIELSGDEQTEGVLHDQRLNGDDFEVLGRYIGETKFDILPIYKKALFVHKDGKRLFVTYWCDVCAIRTYSPGKCWCCQEETALDLIENLP